MEDCKYTLRGSMVDLEDYYKRIDRLDIDYGKKILLTNSLRKRINLIKEYLSEDIVPPKKLSISQMFNRGIKDIGRGIE